MIRVGIVGGTGYTGVELLRLLAMHEHVELAVITSRGNAGQRVDELFPNLRGHCDLAFVEPDVETLATCDAVFFATPHALAMHLVPELLARDVRVVDLSADFRIKDAALWADWYGEPHACPELIADAVYGLPEVNREQIKGAKLLAAPGCYPTAVQLGFAPLVEAGALDLSSLIADTKSGVSGAGRGAKVGSLLCESSENMQAYAVGGHRHLPEIKQGLQGMAGGSDVGLVFVPHLTPMIRGIQATLYGRLTQDVDLQALFEARYADEPAVDVLPAGGSPQTRSVRGSNICRLAAHRPQGGDTVVVLSVIDNLVKGAAGQSVQCFNLMFGLDEMHALSAPALMP